VERVNVVPRRYLSSGDRLADLLELVEPLCVAVVTPDRKVEFGTALVNVVCDQPGEWRNIAVSGP